MRSEGSAGGTSCHARLGVTLALTAACWLQLAPESSVAGPAQLAGFSPGPAAAIPRGPTRPVGDPRTEATSLLRHFVANASVECLLVLRSSARSPDEVILFVCEEDDIYLPDLRGFVSSFRIGLDPSQEVSIEIVHNHPDSLLARTHSSSLPSYAERRRLLGLRGLAEGVVGLQIQRMRSGILPCAVLPPSTDDLATTLKVLLLAERQGVEVSLSIPGLGGRWRLQRAIAGWESRKYAIKRLLLSDRLYDILRGRAAPRNELERRYSALFREYYVVRNRAAQLFSAEAFERFEKGDRERVEEERRQTVRWVARLGEVALRLGVTLEYDTYPQGCSGSAPPGIASQPLFVSPH